MAAGPLAQQQQFNKLISSFVSLVALLVGVDLKRRRNKVNLSFNEGKRSGLLVAHGSPEPITNNLKPLMKSMSERANGVREATNPLHQTKVNFSFDS